MAGVQRTRGNLDERYYKRVPEIAEQVEMLARGGMYRKSIQKVLKILPTHFDEFYEKDFLKGEAKLYKTGIVALMQLIEAGNEKAILLFAKSKLNWIEQEKKMILNANKGEKNQIILLDAPAKKTLDEITLSKKERVQK
jgi:hypothetical protein